MNRIELRGVIVSSMWDEGWFEQDIDKGLMTPESRFRAAVDEARECGAR